MSYKLLTVFIAYLLDLSFGDPPCLPHPVRGIGWLIAKLEPPFRTLIKNERLSGAIFAATITFLVWSTTFVLIRITNHFSRILGVFFSVFFIYSCLAIKDLKVESMQVYEALKNKDLALARKKLALIVGRDTGNLNEREIIRATVETVSENTTDGIISPLFFAFIGGAPLGLLYKAINTLDSMVGYKNARYINFGWATAKLDDIANFIPARISAIFIIISSWLAGYNALGAWRIALRDGRKHPSPNSGIPEAAMAGALEIQLGGLSYYHGVPNPKPYIGDNNNPPEMKHIKESINIAYVSSVLFMVAGMFLFWLTRI